jgi:hypothetical protein
MIKRRQLHDIKAAIDAKVAAARFLGGNWCQGCSYVMPKLQLHDAKAAAA